MSNKQETLIYIEKEQATEADFMSRNFVNKELKNRAYINTLGAELVIKYLSSEGIDVENLHNMHSISKVLESIDIADIQLSNIHIDVRTVFDKEQIFIPKSHFELGITPDIYVVLVLNQDFSHCELAGYFTPEQIDKKDANANYYFINPKKLSAPDSLTKFVKEFSAKITSELSQDEILRGRELSVMLADHNISTAEEKEFLKLLVTSSVLRESVIEYDNFETLAYNTVQETDLTALATVLELPETETVQAELEEAESDTDSDSEEEEEIITEEVEDAEEDLATLDLDEISTQEESLELDNSFLDDLTEAVEENETAKVEEIEEVENISESETTEMNIEDLSLEPVGLDEELTLDLDEEPLTPEENKGLDIGEAVKDTIETIGESALTAGIVTAGTAVGAEIATAASAGEEVIKLAGVAGDVLENLLDKSAENQQESLNKIDYTNINVNAQEIPEEYSAIIVPSVDTSASEEYDEPTDLSELKPVDTPTEQQEVFEHETVNFHEMETLETEEFKEVTDDIVNLNNINFDSPTKPVENLPELINHPEEKGIDLPDVSSYSLDDADLATDQILDQMIAGEQHLTEMPTQPLENIEMPMDLANEEHLLEDLPSVEMETTFNLDKEDESAEQEAKFEEPTLDNEENLEAEQNLEELNIDNFGDFENITTVEEVEEEPITETVAFSEFEEPEQQQENEMIEDISEVPDFTEFEESEEELSDSAEISDFTGFEENEQPEESMDEITEISDFAEFEEVIENTEDENEEPSFDEEFSDITEDVVEGSELDDEFSTDLNTEINADETLHDSEPIKDLEDEVIVENPEEQIQSVIENSTVISDRTLVPGEIPIDINLINKQQFDSNEPLGSIYNPKSEMESGSMLQTPGRTGKNIAGGKAGLNIVGGIIILALVCAIGFGVAKMFKAPNEENLEPTTDDALPTDTLGSQTQSADTLNVNNDNVVNMNNNTDALLNTAQQAKTTAKPTASGKPATATSFLEVRKLTWEVPDYISDYPQFKQYFQAVGKSLKLSLTTDLLLAKEFSYTNELKVATTFNKDGSFKDARIIKSSGSAQIDRIVLQTVNQTLKVLKAPPSVGNDESTTVILKIYF